MKKLILLITVSIFTTIGFSQTKIGYVNYEEVIAEMPEYKKAMSDLETYATIEK